MEEARRRDQRRIQQAQNGRNERRGEVQLEERAQNAALAPVRCIYSCKINIKLNFFFMFRLFLHRLL